MPQALTRAAKAAETALDWITMAFFTVMLLAALSQILFRYVLEIPVPWTEELARTLFVLAMFTGMAFALRDGEHIVVDFLFKKAGPRHRNLLQAVFDVAILGFLAMWARGTVALVELNWNSTLITLPAVRVGYIYLWELLGIALMGVYVLLDLRRRVRSVT